MPRRPGSSERWEHDGGAADAAAAAARIVPPKAAADSRQRRNQSAAAEPAPDKEQPPAAPGGQAQTAIQKAAARVPDRVTAASADAGSPHRQDGANGGHQAEPLQRASRHSRGDGGQKKSEGRRSTHQEKADGVRGVRAEATVARSHSGVSPERRKEVVPQDEAVQAANPEAQEQAAPRGEAVAAAIGSRWLLPSSLLCCVCNEAVRQLLGQFQCQNTQTRTDCCLFRLGYGVDTHVWTGCASGIVKAWYMSDVWVAAGTPGCLVGPQDAVGSHLSQRDLKTPLPVTHAIRATQHVVPPPAQDSERYVGRLHAECCRFTAVCSTMLILMSPCLQM